MYGTTHCGQTDCEYENYSVEQEVSIRSTFRKMLVLGEKIAKRMFKKNIPRKECRVEGQ
jgi:hypothetical protein